MQPSEWFLTIVVLTILGALIYAGSNEDTRSEAVKWVEDTRNGCKLVSTTPLANQLEHIKKTEYLPKLLDLYDCKNGLTAAIIRKP